MLAHAIVTALMVLLMPPFGCAESEPPVATDRSPQDSQDGQTGESEGEATEEPASDDTVEVDGGVGSAEDLLDKLEAAAADLTSFQANITHRETEAVFGDVTTTTGSIIYVVEAEPAAKRFAILFKQQIKNDALREYNEHFIFDGEWLVQKNFDHRDFIKRQIVGPGEEFDPLKLGEGPFPIPIGQKKAEVLTRFDAELAELPEDEKDLIASKLAGQEVWGLALVPKAGTAEAEEFEKVTVYYDRATLLPAGIDIQKTDGARDQVLLLGRQRNAEVDESLIDTTVPESGWRVDIRPWREKE